MIMMLIMVVGCDQPLTQEIKEVEDRHEIEVKDGKVYYKGEAYTGRYKANDSYFPYPGFIAEIRDGMLDGKVVSFNYEDIIKEYRYKEGKLEGKSREYWARGKELKRKIDIKNGEGKFEEYYRTGELMGEGSIKNHIIDGMRKIYHKNGSIKEELNYRDGLLEGEHKTYYESGKKRYIGIYDKGYLVEAEGWYGNGQVAVEKKDKIIKFYRSNGHLYRMNDLNKMKQYYYYDDGSLKKVEDYIKEEINTRGKETYLYHYNQLGQQTWRRRFKESYNPVTSKYDGIRIFDSLHWHSNLYDELGLPVKIEEGEHIKFEGLRYDEDGRMIKGVENGLVASVYNIDYEKNSYDIFKLKADEYGRLIYREMKEMTPIKYIYDKKGRLKNVLIGPQKYTYEYEGNNLVYERNEFGRVWETIYKYTDDNQLYKKYEQYYDLDRVEGDYEREDGIGKLVYELVKYEKKNRKEYKEYKKYKVGYTKEFPIFYEWVEYDKKGRKKYRVEKVEDFIEGTDEILWRGETYYTYFEPGDDRVFYKNWFGLNDVGSLFAGGFETLYEYPRERLE